MGHVHLQSRLPVQLRVLHQCRSLWPKWNALPAEQFVQETVELTRRYDLEMLWVVDDNFLVDLDRAREIAAGLVARRRELSMEHPGYDQPGGAAVT